MESENNSNKDLSKRKNDQKNATETEHRSPAKPKIFIIEMLEEEERSSAKGTDSSRREAMKENKNGTLRGTTASESFSRRVDGAEKPDRSVREGKERKEDTVTKTIVADELNETGSLPEGFDGSKREINRMKNPGKTGDLANVGERRCQRPLREIIGKREQRREELGRTEGDLRQRLDMLECSIPAVMVWNIWRMSQGAPVCRMKRILERQFKDTGELSCRSTPSCHYDRRIREVEAERKLALKRVEEARDLWSEKLVALEERRRKLDEARRVQEEQRNAMERLNEETRVLRETMERRAMEMGELCQCGDAQCKRRHLDRVFSVTSVESGDIRCLEKLQRLAEEEVIAKREIAELERREEAYMRTLQQADELWSRMEGDMVGTTNGLREQLDMKIAANQQLANRVCELEDALEKCQARLATCRAELEKLLSVEKVEAVIGRDDDVAKVVDKEVTVRARVVHRPIGRVDDVALVKDGEVLARVEVADGEALARVEVEDEEALARVVLADAVTVPVEDDKFVRPDVTDLAVDRPVDLVRLEDAECVARPEDIAHERRRFKEVREYLSKLGSLEELYEDDGEPCAPDFVCNDVVSSPTGMTDEELIALGIKYTVPTEERDETVSDEERERQFREELARKARDVVDAVEEKKEREDEIPGVEIERKVVEEMEKQVTEIVDVPVKETVMPQTIEEEAAVDRLVTMPKDREPEVNKIEADRGIVIQRDTILSWIDAIDTIRTTAARHPDCHEVKKDADILAEQVSTYVGIKPKEVKEEDATIIIEGKQEKVIEKNEITKQNKNKILINETKLENELMILKAKEVEPVTKIESIPFPNSVEAAKVIAPMEDITESELLPTKEEVLDMELPTAVSIEDSFQPPAIHDKEDLKDVSVPLVIPEPEIEKIRAEEIKDIAQDKEIRKEEEEETLMVPKMEKEELEVIPNHIERNDKEEKDIPIETKTKEIIIENEKTDEVLPVTEIQENEFVEEIVKKEIPPLDEIKKTDIKETIPHDIEVPEMELVEVPEMEQVEQEETILMDVTEVKEVIPEVISPTVDIIEVEKFEPNKFPIADVEKVPKIISAEEEEEAKIEEPILDVKEEPLFLDTVIEEQIEIKEPVLIKEEIEVAELPLITDIAKEEKIEAVRLPPVVDMIKEEKIEAEEPPLVDIVKEEKMEIIQPISPVIKKEIEEEIKPAEEPMLEIKKEKEIEEEVTLPEEVISPIELPEKKKEEEMLPVEKKKILTEVPPSEKPTLKKEKEVPVEERKPEVVQIELKIPIEIKTEMKMPAIPLEPQLMAQPYLIIAKLKEKELLPIPAKQPCTECCLQPLVETARPFDIPQTGVPHAEIVQSKIIQAEVVQTEVTQTKIVQNEIVQTEIVQTETVEAEVVQITTQTVSIAEPTRSATPPMRIIGEFLKPAELRASRTDVAGDRPEVTGRKMLWRKRLKDQSTVTTASAGSQTDKTGRVSHERVARDERERARVPTDELLRSIKIAAGLARPPDTEREIRTINYGGRSEETQDRVACNCCLCGKIPTPPPPAGARLQTRPQIDARAATPPAAVAAAFKRMFIPKVDRPISHDRLCSDCKAKIQGRMPRERHHVEKIIQRLSRDQESCGCTLSLMGKSCRAVPRRRAIEKRDQACSAKIPKRKTNPAEQKRKDDMQSILEDSENLTVKPLSPSCICFKLEKITSAEPIKKGNCYCAD